MINYAKFTNVNGFGLEFNKEDLARGATLPFRSFNTHVDFATEDKQKPLEHGMFPAHTYMGMRYFEVEGDILEDTTGGYMLSRMDILQAITPRPHLGRKKIGDLELGFDGIAERVLSECAVDGYELPRDSSMGAYGPFMITWKAFDPRVYGASESYAESSGPTQLVGRSYPKTYPKSYVVPGGPSGDMVLTNSGNIETYIEARIYGPVTGPELWLYRPDGTVPKVALPGLILSTSSDYLDLNFRTRTAFVNESQNVYNYSLGSTWWSLDPGDSTIRFFAFSAVAPAKATVKWRNAYMI
jgi:hypothetical protein